jgi:hypothetical protein
MNSPAILFCCAAALRLAYLLAHPSPFATAYWVLADGIRQSGPRNAAWASATDFEPVYPLFLAAARTLVGDDLVRVQVCQVAIASLGAVYLYRMALVSSGRPRVAFISGLLFACYPLLIRQASGPSESALFTTLLVGFASSFVSANRLRDWAMAGLVLGLAVLTRSMVLPVVVFGAAILLIRRRWMPALAFSVAAGLLAAALPARNQWANGSWWPTRSGLNLYVGNSPHSSALIPDYSLDLLGTLAGELVAAKRPDLSPEKPGYDRAVDLFLTGEAYRYMARQPLRTLEQKVKNVAYFFSPRLVPFEIATARTRVVVRPGGGLVVENGRARPRGEVMAHAVSFTLVLVAAIVGVYRRRRELGRDAILWAIVATFVTVYSVYYPATRYTGPMIFVLLFYAAFGVHEVACDVAARRPSRMDPSPALGAG